MFCFLFSDDSGRFEHHQSPPVFLYAPCDVERFVSHRGHMWNGWVRDLMLPVEMRMHLCDFGANLDTCKGPDEVVDGCVGPGGMGFWWSLFVLCLIHSDSLVCRCRSLAVSQEMKWTWGSCPVLILSLTGTQFAPPRLYGYTQWAVQKFTKQARPQVRLWEGITSAACDPQCGTLPNHQPLISHFGVTINHCKSLPAEVCDILNIST